MSSNCCNIFKNGEKVKLTGNIIGHGGFGSVQEGEFIDDHGHFHKVAVKLVEVNPDATQTILNELQVFEKVGKHPNVVLIHTT